MAWSPSSVVVLDSEGGHPHIDLWHIHRVASMLQTRLILDLGPLYYESPTLQAFPYTLGVFLLSKSHKFEES